MQRSGRVAELNRPGVLVDPNAGQFPSVPGRHLRGAEIVGDVAFAVQKLATKESWAAPAADIGQGWTDGPSLRAHGVTLEASAFFPEDRAAAICISIDPL